MLSIKDYAKSKGVSYEAVRKQVSRYKIELDGHIFKTNRTQYLDDEAVAFLDQKRAENPIIIIENDKNEETERLKTENELLKGKILELQELIIKRDDKILELTDKVLLLTQEPPKKRHWWNR